MKKRNSIIAAGVAAIAATSAMALPPLPDWQQLESYHQQDNGTGMARRSILARFRWGRRPRPRAPR